MGGAFVSYSHENKDWVHGRLLPVLDAAGIEAIIDVRKFTAGFGVTGQMDDWQDQAARHLLVLTAASAASAACRLERERAVALDPDCRRGLVIPIRRDDTPLPPELVTVPDPHLLVDLRDDRREAPWAALLKACAATDAALPAADWLAQRDKVVRLLRDRRSVNLVVGDGGRWEALIRHLRQDFPDLAPLPAIDMESYRVASRPTLLETVLRALGSRTALLDRPRDLIGFGDEMCARRFSLVALTHFDMVRHHGDYKDDVELFAALRHLINTERALGLLVQSRAPFLTLLPKGHPMSEIDMTTIDLPGRP